ncbi:EH domain-containing protein 1 [Gryllus bimaculatus]|nr:EH domain-containing protein 1 [Gryllus bimaculatus]
MLWKGAKCICRLKDVLFHRRFLSWSKKGTTDYNNVVDGLKNVYREKLLPLEETYRFHDFHSPMLYDSDFEAKPLVLFMGQYSTGKTTLIKYLLDSDYLGMRIGPEPTTDRFVAVMHDERETIIPGNAVVVDASKQFRPLAKFGNNFLNRFECSTLNNDVLKSISLIDTPGILSGEKQRVNRGYDFTGVLEWFGERVDRIVLLFDAHKLDISDEFRRCIEVLRKHDDKIRIILNKADKINQQQLMRVYGALMWSLGKILDTPEATRVYVGSFWDEPLTFDENRRLFENEEQDLLRDLQSLPRNATLRKLSDLSKRARLAKAHAYLMSHLKQNMPFLGREKAKARLIGDLAQIYHDVQVQHQMSPGDFPDVKKMQDMLSRFDFDKLKSLKPKLVDKADEMLTDISKIMAMIPDERVQSGPSVDSGAFSAVSDKTSPFGIESEGINEGKGETEWVVNRYRSTFDSLFNTLNPVDGKLSRTAARTELVKSKLPSGILGRIYQLSDVDQDGLLSKDEFALAMHLVNIKLAGHELPSELPSHLVPPSHRSAS